jgi:serine/threonine protein phosphatase PrpC
MATFLNSISDDESEAEEDSTVFTQDVFTHSVNISEHVEQMTRKGQDETYSGHCLDKTTGKPKHWAMVTDGHGSNNVINCLRDIKRTGRMADFIAGDEPAEKLSEYITQTLGRYDSYKSGATMCLVECYPDHIKITNMGDSQAVVFINGKIVHISEEHIPKYLMERALLSPKHVRYTQTPSMKIVSPTEMRGIQSEYVVFTNGTEIAMTRALGHCGITGKTPDVKTVPIKETDVIKIVLGSDGLFDMIIKDENEMLCENDVTLLCSMSGEEILTQTVNRWLQPWDIYTFAEPTKKQGPQTFTRTSCDDVSVVVINMNPLDNL